MTAATIILVVTALAGLTFVLPTIRSEKRAAEKAWERANAEWRYADEVRQLAYAEKRSLIGLRGSIEVAIQRFAAIVEQGPMLYHPQWSAGFGPARRDPARHDNNVATVLEWGNLTTDAPRRVAKLTPVDGAPDDDPASMHTHLFDENGNPREEASMGREDQRRDEDDHMERDTPEEKQDRAKHYKDLAEQENNDDG